MTAVPVARGSGVQLICDGCGRAATADGRGLHDADVVYVAVAAVGWAGPAFARGPHRCPRCAQARPVAPRTPRAGAAARRRVARWSTRSTAVVQIVGDLDEVVVSRARTALDRAVAAREQVVVDLAEAPTIDPAGLAMLVRVRQAARRRHGDLLLAGPSRYVRTVMRTMRLHTAFATFDTVQQALTAADAVAGRPRSPVGG